MEMHIGCNAKNIYFINTRYTVMDAISWKGEINGNAML